VKNIYKTPIPAFVASTHGVACESRIGFLLSAWRSPRHTRSGYEKLYQSSGRFYLRSVPARGSFL